MEQCESLWTGPNRERHMSLDPSPSHSEALPARKKTRHLSRYAKLLRPRAGVGYMKRQELTKAILDNAHGYPYLRALEGHGSCVNALTFSSGEGRFLASGGDDLKVLLWDFHQDDVKAPSHTLWGPNKNIFCLEFSATNRYILAGGACSRIYTYDIEALGTPIASTSFKKSSPDYIYRSHSDSIRAITCHPTQDCLFMTASEDGSIIRHDMGERRGGRPSAQNSLQTEEEITGLQYHPTTENLFITSDGSGQVCLRDTRMAFGTQAEQSKEGVVLTYSTKLTMPSEHHLSNPEASSVVFDKDGTKLAVTFLRYLPTIYSLSDPNPLATLSGQNLPDGKPNTSKRKYSNLCTMKHGSFGGSGQGIDDLYASGSDDFLGYVWKIPPIPWLTHQRDVQSADDWLSSASGSTISFTEGQDEKKYTPIEIKTPFCRLTGHNSIVNTTIFHPHLPYILTAGVEKKILLHSPTPTSPCIQNLQRSPTTVRQIRDEYNDEDGINYLMALTSDTGSTTLGDVDDVSERQTLSLFDHILRSEDSRGIEDLFQERRWIPPDECSSPFSGDSDPADVELEISHPYGMNRFAQNHE